MGTRATIITTPIVTIIITPPGTAATNTGVEHIKVIAGDLISVNTEVEVMAKVIKAGAIKKAGKEKAGTEEAVAPSFVD
jgi:hypothetical protein